MHNFCEGLNDSSYSAPKHLRGGPLAGHTGFSVGLTRLPLGTFLAKNCRDVHCFEVGRQFPILFYFLQVVTSMPAAQVS